MGRPTEYVVIRNNLARRGGGVIAFGSETSGDIRHIVAYDNRGVGTNEGVRFKSARTRGVTAKTHHRAGLALRQDAPRGMAVEIAGAALIYRLMLTGDPLDLPFVDRVVDQVLVPLVAEGQ